MKFNQGFEIVVEIGKVTTLDAAHQIFKKTWMPSTTSAFQILRTPAF
jgi:hypothetical protein